jgi:hypothetical protein
MLKDRLLAKVDKKEPIIPMGSATPGSGYLKISPSCTYLLLGISVILDSNMPL